MAKKKYLPYTFKDNFWSMKRVEKKLTIKALAQKCGLPAGRVGAFLSGTAMPDDDNVRRICDVLGVDYNQGQLEFQHAVRNHRCEGRQEIVRSVRVDNLVAKKERDAARKAKREAEKARLLEAENFIKEVKLKQEKEEIEACENKLAIRKEVLKLIYKKVDYETYSQISKILSK